MKEITSELPGTRNFKIESQYLCLEYTLSDNIIFIFWYSRMLFVCFDVVSYKDSWVEKVVLKEFKKYFKIKFKMNILRQRLYIYNQSAEY